MSRHTKLRTPNGGIIMAERCYRYDGEPGWYGCPLHMYEQTGDMSCGARYYFGRHADALTPVPTMRDMRDKLEAEGIATEWEHRGTDRECIAVYGGHGRVVEFWIDGQADDIGWAYQIRDGLTPDDMGQVTDSGPCDDADHAIRILTSAL